MTTRRTTAALLAVSLVLVILAWTVDPDSGLGTWVWIGLVLTLAAGLAHLTRRPREELANYRIPYRGDHR